MSFLRSIAVLVSGAALGHGISAAALPLLSRLYTPADFSILAVFSGVLSIISVAACLRFDVAVSMPESDEDAVNLLALAIGLAASVALALLALVLAAPGWVATQLGQPRLQSYLWLLPLGVFAAASYNALQSWFVRSREFSLIARSRVAQSATGVGVQLAGGVAGAGPAGLIVGYMMNAGAACILLGYRIMHGTCNATHTPRWPSLAGMRRMFGHYQRFPKYSTLEALCNSAAIQLPVVLIAALTAGPDAGYLALAMSVMQAPMALFGTAIGQVYLSRAPEEYRSGRLGPFTAEILGGLLKAGVGPLLAAGVLAPVAFTYVFGDEWQRAGELVAWMTPWFILQFLASPISMALHVTGHQRAALALQVFGLVLRVLSVWLAARLFPAMLAEAYALSGIVLYGLYLVLVLVVVRVPLGALRSEGTRSIPLSALWVLGALLLAWVVQ